MSLGGTIRLEYDDNAIDIIDAMNEALEEHGLKFEDDGKEHDGFIILTLVGPGPKKE